jgi:cytochrome P450
VAAWWAVRFDPYGDECHRDPYPVYRALRDHEPVYHDAEQGFWALSRFDDVIAALHSPAAFQSGDGIALEGQARSPYPMIIAMDPPRHDQLRALLARGFTARPVAANAAGVRALARELIDAFADKGRVEFVDAYSGALPLYVIGNLLGIERDGLAEFRRLGNALMDQDPAEPESIEAGKAASKSILDGIMAIIAQRRRAPGTPSDDLVSALLAAEVDGERLREEEVIGFCYLLILAGTETTANLLANGVMALAAHPEQRAELRADPSLIPGAVEEMLRWDSPVQSDARTMGADVELHGRVIPAGDKVLLLFGSAGRDEREYADPDRFDIHRRIERHLTFGHGIHYCLGAALARLEGQVTFEELLARLPDWEVDADPRALPRVRSYMVRGPSALPLAWPA